MTVGLGLGLFAVGLIAGWMIAAIVDVAMEDRRPRRRRSMWWQW